MTILRVDEQLKKQNRNSDSSMKHCGHYSDEGDRDVDDDGVKRFYGDGLVVRMRSNHRALEITGDGCWIVLSKNFGSVHVVGDGCRLRVEHNVGDINYTGDGGRVLLGPGSSEGKVKFVGDSGKVIRNSSRGAESMKSSKDRRSEEPIYVRQHIKVVRKTPRCEKCDDERVRDQEGSENMMNEKKEIIFREKCKINEEKQKSSRNLSTVTRIVTMIHGDDPCVRKRIGDSSLVINSRGDSRPLTKNTSETPSTNAKIQ